MKNFFRRPRDRSDTSTRGLRQRRGSARNQLSACALALASLTNAGPAAAQHCHHLQPNEPGKIGLSVGLASEFATYRNTSYEGEYQGLALRAGWDHRWIRLRAALPAYRLTRNGSETYGAGDVLVDVRVPLARTEDDTLEGGVILAGTLPSGDAERSLGMGHPMVMPGAWVTARTERAFLSVQLLYGRALTSGAMDHHHHMGGMTGPLVNPMNSSEVEMAVSGGGLLVEQLRLRGGLYGAVPVAAADGAERAAVFAGVDLLLSDWIDMGAELHLPVAGTPFLAKTVVSLAARF